MYQVNNNDISILLHRKSSRYYNVPGKCLEVLGRGIIWQNEKDKETVCNVCMCYDLLGTFCVEEVFLLLCMEGSFIFLPTDDMATVVDIRSHVTVSGSCCNLERCFIANDGICCSEMLVGGEARVQLRDPCSLTYKMMRSEVVWTEKFGYFSQFRDILQSGVSRCHWPQDWSLYSVSVVHEK